MATELRLPEFERPPVVETVLSVRFRETAGLTTASIVQFWESELVSDFPEVAEQAPYSALIEHLGQDAPSGGFPIQLETGFPSPRFWFKGGAELVQLQPDWFAYNWRQTKPDDEYVRYAHTRARFVTVLDKLRAFVEQRGGKLEPVQCEVTYVNHILLQDDDLALGPLGNVLKGVSTHIDRQLPIAESARLATSYLLRDPNTDQALGRLHVVAESARLGVDRRPAILLNITARGRPRGSSLDDTLAFCDMGRAWVVNGFKDLTTTPMHERWGLKEDHQ